MPKNDNYNHTELVWDGKFERSFELPQKHAVSKIALPFQAIELINEPREGTGANRLFSGQRKEDWSNKLIWGDNKLVMSSLLKEYASKINLIYIDPPFDVGADFSVKVKVGDEEITKQPSILEEKAYRDTWGRGTDSYLQMIYERLLLMRELLAENGSIYVHCDWRVSGLIRLVLDEVFTNQFRNHIIWSYGGRGAKAIASQFPRNHDDIFFYSKTGRYKFERIDAINKISFKGSGYKLDEKGRCYRTAPRGMYTDESVKRLEKEGRILRNSKDNIRIKYFEDFDGEFVYEKKQVGDVWDDIADAMHMAAEEKTGYATQKPEALLRRIIKASSNEGDLVADFFCGSGTTGAVAERLGRRWIMSDLGRFAIHTSRKRLMEVQRKLKEESKGYYPFEILNLGKYERQHWQTAVVNGGKKTSEGKKIAYYVKFILELYHGETIGGFTHLHGKKDNDFVHIGAVDAPVTMNEIKEAVEECRKNSINRLDVLGWEWEMGVNEEAIKLAKSKGVRLKLLQIPREVMDKRAAEDDDVRFFELDYVEVDVEKKGVVVSVRLKNFAIPSEEFIPSELREKIQNWSDYVDYWSVDWDYERLRSLDGEPVFQNDWQTFRTKKNPKLELQTPAHAYAEKGKYLILVKIIDIFGNDTSKVIEIKI